MALITDKKPREQAGRDTFARYRAQVRSTVIASLSMLGQDTADKIYCDFHDDFVIRKKDENGYSYIFYQVKTNEKQNHNWSMAEVFGIPSKRRKKDKKSLEEQPKKIKESFIGKLLLHTIIFDEHCNSVIFQTNINNDDDIEKFIEDIESGAFAEETTKTLLDNFNKCFNDEATKELTIDEIKLQLSKLKFDTDVQYLKEKNNGFEEHVREKIHEYSEIDLEHDEVGEILLKLTELVSKKSSGKICILSPETIDEFACVTLNDLLSVLAITKEAYETLVKGQDIKAVKSVSIIQRILSKSGATEEQIIYCSKCKAAWDSWFRTTRHEISDFNYNTLQSKIISVFKSIKSGSNIISIDALRDPILNLKEELKQRNTLNGLDEESLLGAFFHFVINQEV